MDQRLHKLGQYLRGWTAYYGISEYYRPVPELDDWIRRRIRMCYWKQWRWVRTKIKHLLALGRGPRLQVRLRGLGRSEGAELRDAAACKAEPEAWPAVVRPLERRVATHLPVPSRANRII